MYREIYFHNYCINDTGDNARLSIRKNNYGGSSRFVDAGPVPFKKSILNSEENLIGGIYPTMAEIQLIGTESFGMDDLVTANDSDFQIVHLVNGEIDWIGFLTPESFGEVDTNNIRYLDINAFDGLTRLKDLKFVDASGKNFGATDDNFQETILFAVKECLKKTGLNLDVISLIDRLPIPITGDYIRSNVNIPLDDNWIYSQSFNGISEDLVKEGNYLTWKFIDDVAGSVYTSQIIEVDRSEVSQGGGTGVQLSPAPLSSPTGDLDREVDFLFFKAEGNKTLDVLEEATHDLRVWINPEAKIDSESKDPPPYWEYTVGTWKCWDVLNAIALAFDFKVSQDKGLWVLSAVDIHRIEDDFFHYDYNGVYKGRLSQSPDVIVPCEANNIFHRLDGNTRYIDKTLKSVNVGYEYRFKVEGDPLTNLIKNGKFILSSGNATPSIFTPSFWNRKSTSSLNLSILSFPDPPPPDYNHLLMTGGSNQKFKWNNGIQQGGFFIEKNDVINIGLWHNYTSHWVNQATYGDAQQYVAIEIKLTNKNDTTEVYYLVNKGDEDGLVNNSGFLYLSGKQTGQWVKKALNNNKAYYYKSNAVELPIPTAEGSWTGWKDINIKCDAAPFDGDLEITIIGSATEVTWKDKKGSNADNYTFYRLDRDLYDQKGEVSFVEEMPDRESGLVRYTSFENQFNDTSGNPNHNFYPSISVADVSLTKISGQSKGKGRLYEYRQSGDYFDTINDITIQLGDEQNVDHLSVINVQGSVCDKWITRSGGIQLGSLGLTLSRTLIRRYYAPKRMIDGGISSYPYNLSNLFVIEDYLDYKWFLNNGEVDLKNHLFNGTFVQLHNIALPKGGVDYGPNSLINSSSSSGGIGGGGAGGAMPGGNVDYAEKAGYADRAGRADIATHADTASHANTSDLATHSLTADHANTADLATRALRADLADNSILWNGLAQPNYVTQPVRPVDSPKFEGVGSQSFVSGFSGKGYRLAKDANGDYLLELDRLSVRKDFSVYELIVNQIRATNGSLWVSDGIKITGATVSGSNFVCDIDTDGGTIYTPFAVNDIVRCQKFNSKNLKYYTARVVSVTSDTFTITKLEGASNPASGDELVRIGNTSNANRQGALYLTSSDSGAPFLDVIDGVTSASLANKTKVRLGKLDGIVDQNLGALSGYGIYANRGYFVGQFHALSGSNVYNKGETQAEILSAEGRINLSVTNKIDGIQIGGVNLVVNSTFNLGFSKWSINSAYRSILPPEEDKPNSSILQLSFNSATSLASPQMNLVRSYISEDSEYTVSFDFYCPDLNEWDGTSGFVVRKFSVAEGGTAVSILNITKSLMIQQGLVSGKWKRVKFITPIQEAGDYITVGVYLSGTKGLYRYREIQLEKGNKETSWDASQQDVQESVNAVQSSVTDLSITVDAQQEAIALRATKAEVTASQAAAINTSKGYTDGQIQTVNTTINDVRIDLNAANASIALKADRSVTDGLNTRMNNAEQKITPDAINMTVASQVDEKIGAIEVGANNLLGDSNFSEGFGDPVWNSVNGTRTKVGGNYQHTATGDNSRMQATIKLNKGDYVVSANVKSVGSGFRFSAFAGVINAEYESYNGVSEQFRQIHATFSVANDDTDVILRLYSNGNTSASNITVEWIVLLAGNKKAVSWFPSFSDYSTTEKTKSEFNMTNNKISLFSKEIELSGVVTFQGTNAQNAANAADGKAVAAQNTANTANTKAGQADSKAVAAQNTANSANGTANAANNQVNLWKFPNTTEIDGGKIRADSILANRIKAGSVFTQKLTAENFFLKEGQAGPLKVYTDYIGIGNDSTPNSESIRIADNYMSLYSNGSGGTDRCTFSWNVFGRNSPSSDKYSVQIENTLTNSSYTNTALMIDARGGNRNRALEIRNGYIQGGSWSNRVMGNGTTALTNSDDIIAIPNTGSYLFNLPSSPEDGKTIQFVRAHSSSVTIQFSGNGRGIFYKGVESSSVTATVTGYWGIAVYIKASNKWFLASN